MGINKIKAKERTLNFLVLLFSFFLGFGKFDPFGTQGLYFDILTIMVICIVLLFTDVIKEAHKYIVDLMLLFSISVILLITNLFYGYVQGDSAIFNFKYVAAITIFWLLSYIYSKDPSLCLQSILLFSLSCSIIAVIYHLGLFGSIAEVRNGRLNIFEENPNSISSRMAIAFIIIAYYVLEDPLKFKVYRVLLIVFLPFLFFFIVATGSRGSFLALVLGIGLITFFSKLPKQSKFMLLVIAALTLHQIFVYIQDTSLIERFTVEDVTSGRGEIWSEAITIFYDYPWGVGERGYINEMILRFSTAKDTHNLYLYLLITGGWISLLFFAIFLIRLLKKAMSALYMNNSLLLVIFIFLLFLASKTGGVLTYLIMWYFFAVINSFNEAKNSSPYPSKVKLA